MMNGDTFTAVDGRAVAVLSDLCRYINSAEMIPAPPHVKEVRRRMMKYLRNALFYNVHYKDLGHTNVPHMTNFPMYPLSEGAHRSDVYPLFAKLFGNTVKFNGGYLDHCDDVVIAGRDVSSPFVARRDFDLALVYFVLTGAIRLTKCVCRSYLFKGSFNPLKDVYKVFVAVREINRTAKAAVRPKWFPYDGCGWMLPLLGGARTERVSKDLLATALMHCGGFDMQRWTAAKVSSVIERVAEGHVSRYALSQVPLVSLVTADKGMYVVNDGEYGFVTNRKPCYGRVYLWAPDEGVIKYDDVYDFLNGPRGARIRKVERLSICPE